MGLNTIGLGLQKTNGQENKAERTTENFVQLQLKVAAITSSAYPSFGSGLILSNNLGRCRILHIIFDILGSQNKSSLGDFAGK